MYERIFEESDDTSQIFKKKYNVDYTIMTCTCKRCGMEVNTKHDIMFVQKLYRYIVNFLWELKIHSPFDLPPYSK